MHYLADASSISANLNLTTISGKPRWAPQKTTLWVGGASPAEADIVLVDEKDVSFTITVPVGMTLVLTRPFKQLTDTGTEAVSVIFEWFDHGGSTAWNK
jgi:hypothetical protein